jgi:cytochrome c-type biogenesis protein CcmH
VALIGAAVVIGALLILRPGAEPTQAEQAEAIAATLRCPDCAGLSAADSPTRSAAEIRRLVAVQVAAGLTADEIRATFVAQYGEWILLEPPGLAPWLIPLLATAAGAAILAVWLLRPTRSPVADGDAEGAKSVDQSTLAANPGAPGRPSPTARRALVGVAIGLVIALGIGYLLPEPYSLAAETVVNQPLAQAQAAEAARLAEIQRLLALVAADPNDRDAMSALADAYLAGTTAEDLQAGAQLLRALISLDPNDPDPYGRLITAYIRAEDWTNAEAATDALADLDPDSADVPFFQGLIAWQGHRDADAALAAFDEFLADAPDDPRVPMIRALRSEAAAD